MASYSAHWSVTILAAIIFNVIAVFGFAYALPQLMPAPEVQSVSKIELLDVELADEVAVLDEEAIPSTAPEKNSSPFNAQDLVLPEVTKPAPIELPKPAQKPIELPKPKPPPTVNRERDTTPKPAVDKADKTPEPPQAKQMLTKPPVTIMAVYPEKGSLLGFKGYISFAVHIGKDGKVKSSEILQSSGRTVVDEIARKAAEQWTFRPALDQFGRPMECDKIITFDFKKDA